MWGDSMRMGACTAGRAGWGLTWLNTLLAVAACGVSETTRLPSSRPATPVASAVEVPNEPDAQRAVQQAWRKIKPTFALKEKHTTHPPAKDGWDASMQVVYETPGAEPRTTTASAQRKGTTQYVALVDGTNAGFDRRRAQLMTIVSTFKAPGVAEESLASRQASSSRPTKKAAAST